MGKRKRSVPQDRRLFPRVRECAKSMAEQAAPRFGGNLQLALQIVDASRVAQSLRSQYGDYKRKQLGALTSQVAGVLPAVLVELAAQSVHSAPLSSAGSGTGSHNPATSGTSPTTTSAVQAVPVRLTQESKRRKVTPSASDNDR